MVDFEESVKMIKMSEKMDKSNTYNEFTGNISFFIHKTYSDKTFFEFSFILSNLRK